MTQPSDLAVASYADLQRTCAELLEALKDLILVIEHDDLMPPHLSYFKHAKELVDRCEGRK